MRIDGGSGRRPETHRLSLRDGDNLAAHAAAPGSGLPMVEAALRRVVHPSVTGPDGSSLPALVEYWRAVGLVTVRAP